MAPRDLGTAAAGGPTFRLNLSSPPRPERVRFQLAADSAFTDVRAEDAFEATGPLAKWAPGAALEDSVTYYLASAHRVCGRRGARLAHRLFHRTGRRGRQRLGAAGRPVHAQRRLQRAGGTWVFDTFEIEVSAYSERRSGATPFGFFLGGGTQNYLFNNLGIGVLILDGKSEAVKSVGSYCTYPTRFVDNSSKPCTGSVDGEAAIARLDSLLNATLEEGDYLLTAHLR